MLFPVWCTEAVAATPTLAGKKPNQKPKAMRSQF
ncbi:hypothetical protein CGRA01v4_01164 [Colletotrichum graminicola]|nr:hypothetical protein CGRA01v4_01164 [Colletotrichum graminicola]